jgi:hypothetical protein
MDFPNMPTWLSNFECLLLFRLFAAYRRWAHIQ